jgi:hypothetical protein
MMDDYVDYFCAHQHSKSRKTASYLSPQGLLEILDRTGKLSVRRSFSTELGRGKGYLHTTRKLGSHF